MQISLHQTHHQISDFEGIFTYIKQHFNQDSSGIHLFPELFLTGYPLQDLCLQKPFVHEYLLFLERLNAWLQDNIDTTKCCLLMGGLHYTLTKNKIPKKIINVIYQFGDKANKLTKIYTKRLLPNYDIFDEKKYFSKGSKSHILQVFNKNYGLLICEDMWASSFYKLDPVEDLYRHSKDKNLELDGIFNLSASPYVLGKIKKRIKRASYISKLFKCPFYYTNRVGAEDEILFDGSSFVVAGENVLEQAKIFKADLINCKQKDITIESNSEQIDESLTWEELFQADLNFNEPKVKLNPWSKHECEEILQALCFGFQDYATKNGFSKFTIALSGGIDSALVLAIIKISLQDNQYLEAIYMPSVYSRPISYDLSLELCKQLQIPLKTLPIKFLHSTAKNLFQQSYPEPFEGLSDENIQSRLRGMLLYTRSNQINSMVVNTSNKSELAVGYSTQYGDSVGAISMLGDLYKSQVYQLADYINSKYPGLIPQGIITRGPSAELREDQLDTQSLPPYDELDAMLEGILNYRYTKADLIKFGFSIHDVEKTLNMYKRNEYKRYQFCPIIKVSTKSFGFGYRVPISKENSFYNK